MRYQLYDLEVTTSGNPQTFNCSHTIGQGFYVEGENIRFKEGTQQFSHYVLASLMPYIAAKQRANNKEDWMMFETAIACPDPQCGARFMFKQLRQKMYEYYPIDKR